MPDPRPAPGPSLSITVDGAEVPLRPGQTIAAALVAAGRPGWRTTRRAGEARGLFCGIGVCYDCLVTVNGVPSVRACLTPAAPGDVVTLERGTGHDHLAV